MPAKKAAAAKKTSGSRSMSAEHKAALAAGRESGRAVRSYLEALETNKPKRGRKRTPESIDKRLAAIDDEIGGADPVKRLSLIQEQMDLAAEKESLQAGVDLSALEADFVKHAKTYSQNKGISYSAWRTIGVPADVLKKADISRGAA